MPAKAARAATKKPRPCPPPAPPKAEPSLYKAIRERLETKDKETLHARTKKAVEAVEHLLEGTQPVQEVAAPSEAPVASAQVPWSLNGLVVDPGEEAVGQWGWFWGGTIQRPHRGFCIGANGQNAYVSGRDQNSEEAGDARGQYSHFAHMEPSALLKATTGYEAP